MPRRSYFRAYAHNDPRPACSQLSFTYFHIAQDLRKMIGHGRGSAHFSSNIGFPVVVFYVAAVDAFINENLNYTSLLLKLENSRGTDIARIRSLMEKSVGHEKIRSCLEMYAKCNNIDMNFSQDFIHLVNVRNKIIHYVPDFDINMNEWPHRLEQAIRRAGMLPGDKYSMWTAAVRSAEFIDWCHDTVKRFLKQFCQLTGMASPFEAPEPLRWG